MKSFVLAAIHSPRIIAWLLCMCLLFASNLVAGQQKLTADEKAAKEELLEAVGRRCEITVSDAEGMAPSSFTATIVQKVLSRRYCSCLAEKMDRALTPEVIHMIGRSEGEKVGAGLAATCMRMRLEEEWAAVCPLVVQKVISMREAPNLAPQDVGKICSCGKGAIADLEKETTSTVQMIALSITKINVCADENGIEIGGQPFTRAEPSPALIQLEKPEPDLAGAAKAVRNFGLGGRWSKDCADTGSNNGLDNLRHSQGRPRHA